MTTRINKPDTAADTQLKQAIDLKRSFVMIAGAGSGKTTSLVKALSHTITSRGAEFRKWGQKVACITYTEVAAKEIWNDVGNNSLAHVSTIHSFLWTLIAPFQKDIKKWVSNKIDSEIVGLDEAAAAFTNRTRQTTRDNNQRKKEKLQGNRQNLAEVKNFIYGTGRDYSKGILGHDDIITMVPNLIAEKPLLRSIIAQSYPVVFIDESQDTNSDVVLAFKTIASSIPKFCLGFFGDPMQKIYLTGVGSIPLEQGWDQITKPENFRCSTSVINVINGIRLEDDGLRQEPGPNNRDKVGSARFFVLPADDRRTERLELVKQFIARSNDDPEWTTDNVKLLVIVHRMAARRLDFIRLYEAMNDNAPETFKNGLLDGTAWPLKPFLNFALPLVEAHRTGRKFDVVEILREKSPLFEKEHFKDQNVANHLNALKTKVDALTALFARNATIGEGLRLLHESGLFVFDAKFIEFIAPQQNGAQAQPQVVPDPEADNEAQTRGAMNAFMLCPLNELYGYKRYIEAQSPFATQHGVKGTEYNRVLTICDDEEGSYNLFSYDKYFGVEAISANDIRNHDEGNDNAVDRTRRLFYVCCSRAEADLAVIYFVADPANAVQAVRRKGLFLDNQIFTLNDIAN